MYVYIYVYIYICVYICIHVYICVYMHIYIYVYICDICVYVCMYIYIYIYMSICLYVYMCICVYVYMSICLYVCMSICIYVLYVGIQTCTYTCIHVQQTHVTHKLHFQFSKLLCMTHRPEQRPHQKKWNALASSRKSHQETCNQRSTTMHLIQQIFHTGETEGKATKKLRLSSSPRSQQPGRSSQKAPRPGCKFSSKGDPAGFRVRGAVWVTVQPFGVSGQSMNKNRKDTPSPKPCSPEVKQRPLHKKPVGLRNLGGWGSCLGIISAVSCGGSSLNLVPFFRAEPSRASVVEMLDSPYFMIWELITDAVIGTSWKLWLSFMWIKTYGNENAREDICMYIYIYIYGHTSR